MIVDPGEALDPLSDSEQPQAIRGVLQRTPHTKALPTPDHSSCYPNRSPIRTGLSASTSIDAIVSAASCMSANMPPDLPG